MDRQPIIKILRSYPGITARMDLSEDSALVVDLARLLEKEKIEARIDERENMKFMEYLSIETCMPFIQYRYEADGLLLDWDDRTDQLEQQLKDIGENGGKRKNLQS